MDENLETEFSCVKLAEIGSEGWKRKLHWDSSTRGCLADFLDLVELNELKILIQNPKMEKVL